MPQSVTKHKTNGVNKHGALKIIDTFEMYQASPSLTLARPRVGK
jgi:hypothetical protein